MKYSILGFQQNKLIANKLTVEDAFILRTIKDMYSTSSMDFKDFEGIKYMWINYTYLLAQVPIVGSKRNLMRKIEQYGKDLFILRILEKSRNGKRGNYSYITPTKKLDELQDFDLMTETHKGYDKNDIRVMTESHNKDTSIIDTSIKDNIHSVPVKNIQVKTELEIAIDDFTEMRKATKKPMTQRALTMLLKKLEELSTDTNTQIKILNQSTMSNWSTIYEVKENKVIKSNFKVD